MDQFISKDVLDILSYHSTLGRSLKQISLRKTPLPIILDDIEKYRASYIDTIFQENLIGSRFKSEDSIKRKYVYKYKNPEIGYQLYRKYVDGKIKNKEEFLKNLKEMEWKEMIDKSIYVVAKIFDQQGCIAYRCKTLNEARCLPGTLEALRAEGVQIVILDDPDIYSEYAPYEYIEDMKEFIDKVNMLNKIPAA